MKQNATLLRTAAIASIAALLAACGGHSGALPPARTASSAGGTHATLVVKIPKHTDSSQLRRRAYISASTQSVKLSYSIGGTSYPDQTFNVTPQSPGCTTDTNGNTECVASFGAQPGSAAFTVSTYDALDAGGNLLATASSTLTVVAGKDNQFAITLDGVPKSFKLGLKTNTVTSGTAADIPLTISAYDSDNNLIVDSPQFWSSVLGATYDTATITTSDTTEFTVTQNGTTLPTVSGDPSTYQTSIPFGNLAAHYTGSGMSVGTLTLKTPGTGLSDEQLITVQAQPPTITEYQVPSGPNGPPVPAGIAVGTDGLVRFVDNGYGSSGYSGRIGTVASDGTITMVDTPEWHEPYSMTLGPDGNFWMTDQYCGPPGYLMTASPSNAIQLYSIPSETNGSCPGGLNNQQIVAGPDQALWFAERNSKLIGRMTTSGAVTEYATTSGPVGITVGPDANIWFTEPGGDMIGTIVPSTGKITEFPLPAGSSPRYITTGNDGNLWFTDDANASPKIGKMTTSGKVTEYSPPYQIYDPYYAGPMGIFTAEDGTLWYGDEGHIGSVDPKTGTITDYPASGWGCAANPIPQFFAETSANTIWYTDYDGCIGKIVIH